jgi:hypothetical protein
MNTPSDTLTATAALVNAASRSPAHELRQAVDHDVATAALREAQIELYCGHDAAAVTALHEARRALASVPSETAALATMESAVWHIRRHEASEAQRDMAIAHQLLA